MQQSDPSNVFHLISNDLHARLPLRNLHWNSPSRPLRSIDSLFVEFVPDRKSAPQFQGRSASVASLSGAQDNASSTSLANEGRRESEPFPLQKERRHQIPGLRQTPYLKVYLLRCDDVDTYKSSSRRMLREWIKEHTSHQPGSGSANSQENHDAFEWMIIHEVLPDPASASGWSTRTSSNVLEKLRADFNGSSKPAIDRVAQVPASKSTQAQGARANSVPAGIVGRDEYSMQAAAAWEDVITKVKSLILASFDLRVRQYEEDIKEKGSQRNLPGWNFCTFFVLKEGLARGFENVGLVEDALIGYDELSIELQMAIRDQKEKASSGQHPGLFREHTQELLTLAESAYQQLQSSPGSKRITKQPSISVLDSDRKHYRELILANNISAFDFQNYVFSRQFSLLSRMAGLSSAEPTSPRKHSRPNTPNPGTEAGVIENLSILAEICSRALGFITATGRMIREDLRTSFHNNEQTDEASAALRFGIIEDLVAAWTFTTGQQVLAKTNVSYISKQLQLYSQEIAKSKGNSIPRTPFGKETVAQSPPLSTLPRRISSLLGPQKSVLVSPEQQTFSDTLASSQRSPVPTQSQTSLHYFAAHRAELYLVARRALSSLGLRRGWKTGWTAVAIREELGDGDLDEVPLDEETKPNEAGAAYVASSTVTVGLPGLQNDELDVALASEKCFYSAYEDLTRVTLQLYQFSGNQKFTEGLTADLATVRFYLKDYEAAALYFRQLAPFYAGDDWNNLEIGVLDMYSRCLKKLDQLEEYIRVSLRLVAKLVRSKSQNTDTSHTGLRFPNVTGFRDIRNDTGYLRDLIEASERLEEPISIPMEDYFTKVHVDPYLEHFVHKDGFQLTLEFRYIVTDEITADQIKIRLVNIDDKQAGDIWLTSGGPTTISYGRTKVPVTATTIIPGWYKVDKITVSSAKILFTYDFSPVAIGGFFDGYQDNASTQPVVLKPHILVWPSSRALGAHVDLNKEIHLEQSRSIVIDISSGSNLVTRGRLLVRAGSAGLRLLKSDAKLIQGDSNISYNPPEGIICFEQLAADMNLKIRVPYKLETDMKDITIKIEVTYSTEHGEFSYVSTHTLSILLPLGVNVQDVFKQGALFSKFAISASTSIPLDLLSCHLEGTRDFEAKSPLARSLRLFVSTKQPASMVYKISHKKQNDSNGKALQTRLSMYIEYQCLDEAVCSAVRYCLLGQLQGSKFTKYTRLLSHSIEGILRSRLSPPNYERIGLLRDFDMGSFYTFHWDKVLGGLPFEARQELVTWLQSWHQENPTIDLEKVGPTPMIRRIVIPVDVPQLQIIHTASLRVFRDSQSSGYGFGPVAVGQAITAELKIKYSREWDTREDTPGSKTEKLGFYYALDASPDTWLIGGQRRAYFTAAEDQVVTFPILLIPQRPGYLLYPSIDIRPDEQHEYEQDMRSPSLTPKPPPLTCEIDYRNHGESILVVPNVSSTTVSLEPDGHGGGAWLVEAETKHATTLVR
ncbi:MAG: hypothetical protein Q9187_000868 [Circinaria calcarea]